MILHTPDSEQVHAIIAAYQAERLHPELPHFRIYHHTNLSWRGMPETCHPGVYVLYCWRGELRYIGKASEGRWLQRAAE